MSENNYLRYKHSKNLGDLISILPGIKHLCETTGKQAIIYQRLNMPVYIYNDGKHPVVDKDGEAVCMNEYMFEMAKPLLEFQDYIKSFEPFKGQETDYDLDTHLINKAIPIPASDIHHWQWFDNPELSCDLSKQWLSVDKKNLSSEILINFTSRYRNPYITYFFLKEYEDKIMFIGTEEEYDDFSNKWELDITYMRVGDFLMLAELINSCGFFMGNQSMNWHIADALKVPRMLEVCSQFPNTLPTGANGYAYVKQNKLEQIFKILLNEK
jgi:hypothetical protein